tara:strand:+ start:1601 stop:4192 length:2592 start_codon:yes stop_codon:yes gene_type:complete
MAKASHAFTNFTAGELSPRLDGRTDVNKYFNGCSRLENFIIHPHGGASRRPGTKFIASVKTAANATRLIPFEFSVTQTYVLEFGHNYFRIYKDGGQVVSSGSAVEVATPYGTSDLSAIKFTQSADLMYLVHPDYSPRVISRSSHTAWTIAEVAFRRGPMQDENSTTTTLVASASTGNPNITASASLFVATDVGRIIKLHEGYAKISSITSATVAVAAVQENSDGRTELLPSYTADTIGFAEGDPSSTGLEHNDRITDSTGDFVTQGFKVGQFITVTGAGTSGNNVTNKLVVQVTADTILLAPSADLVTEAAGQDVTIVGVLAASTSWSFGAFSATTGFPSTVTFFEERLVFANTATEPQTLFFSVSGDFTDFAEGITSGSSLTYTIGSNQVNVIRYLVAARSLIVGTSGGEYVVTSGTQEPLNPTNTQIKRQTTYGTADIQPVQVGNVTLFVQRAKRKVRELGYNYDADSYTAPDLTILAEHITESGIKEFALQQEPDNIVWCVLENGKLVGMTYRREEQVVAWHEHIIGGRFGTCTVTVSDYANIAVGTTLTFTKSDGSIVTFTSEAVSGDAPADTSLGWRPNESNNTTADNIFTRINAHADFTVANPSAAIVTIFETNHNGSGFLSCVSSDTTRLVTTDEGISQVESLAIVPGDLDEDSVYMIVKRTVNGAVSRSIEYFSAFDFGTDVTDAFFVDSALSYSGSAATSMSGLGHLEGETVAILADGSTHPTKSVASGALTLERTATKAHIGLNYSSILQTMRIEAGGTEGTSQAKIKRIHDVTLRLYRSVGAKVGSLESELDLIHFRSSADRMDTAIGLFSGDKEVEFRGGYDSDAFVLVKQDQPLPLTILAIYPRLITYDQ